MPDIDALKSLYFVQAADASPPTEPVPQTFQDSRVTPLIDGASYNNELSTALELVGTGPDGASNAGHFILIANWWLGLLGGEYEPPPGFLSSFGPQVHHLMPYNLDGPGGPPARELVHILKEKARIGVDVWVMGWVSFAIMDSAIAQLSGAGNIAAINSFTMKSVKELRAEPKIGPKAILNVVAHTGGAVHAKIVVIGTNTEVIGFTGGIDFEMGRYAHPKHVGGETWHDVVAKVEGPAVQALYDWFQLMWTENRKHPVIRFHFEGKIMPHFLPEAPIFPTRTLPTTPKGSHHVQSLRTIPKFNYRWDNCLPENPRISFAPDGLFEVRVAMRKALQNAQTYIYVEDQAFWSHEILWWINKAIQAQAGLRVILVASGGADPNDPEFPVEQILSESINHGLLDGLTAAKGQIRMYKRYGDTVARASFMTTKVTDQGTTSRVQTTATLPRALPKDVFAKQKYFMRIGADDFPIIGNDEIPKGGGTLTVIVQNLPGSIVPPSGAPAILLQTMGITMHTKSILIDDHWAIIGSANIMRRSLYTDCEHSVSILDENDLVVKEYRKALWAEHFRHPSPADFDDIQAALHSWESSWGIAGSAPSLPSRSPGDPGPPYLDLVPLPLTPDLRLKDSPKDRYDSYLDPDSRDAWGGLFP